MTDLLYFRIFTCQEGKLNGKLHDTFKQNLKHPKIYCPKLHSLSLALLRFFPRPLRINFFPHYLGAWNRLETSCLKQKTEAAWHSNGEKLLSMSLIYNQ